MYVWKQDPKVEILNIIHRATQYREITIVCSQLAQFVKDVLERAWLYRHRRSKYFRADHEFCRPYLTKSMQSHGVEMKPRPSRSKHRSRQIVRSNGVCKPVLMRVEQGDQTMKERSIYCAIVVPNQLFHGSITISSFQLAICFTPSILGAPRQAVSQQVFNAHTRREATSSFEKVLKAGIPQEVH